MKKQIFNRKKISLLGLTTALSATAIAVAAISTSCSTPTSITSQTNSMSVDGSVKLNSKFVNSVDKIVSETKITPKEQYAHLYASAKNWSLAKITSEYFDGFPSPRDVNMLMSFVRIASYEPKDGEMTVEILFQDPELVDQNTTRLITISGFAKESGLSIMNRLYGPENVKIIPKWEEFKDGKKSVKPEDLFATKSNWSREKITDKYFYGLPQSSNGVEPVLADIICDNSDLGQLQLKYKFYFNNEEIATRIYTVDGFAKEDFQVKVERLYGDVVIKARPGAKKFSATSLIWNKDKITSSWFEGLPVSKEGIEVSVKEVITDPELETQGAIQIVINYAKDGASFDKTYEVDGFYKDEDVAASNMFVAERAIKNLKLNKYADPAKFKVKDIARKDVNVISKLFDIPKVPYVSIDYEVLSWRNWKEGEEKLPAGSFKLRFTITDNASGRSKVITSKLFYGFEDVLGQWNELFVYNDVKAKLTARDKDISWRQFYTGTGRNWDYSRDNVLPATGQRTPVWLPVIIPDIPGTSPHAVQKAKAKKRIKELKIRRTHVVKAKRMVEDLLPDMKKLDDFLDGNRALADKYFDSRYIKGIDKKTLVAEFDEVMDEIEKELLRVQNFDEWTYAEFLRFKDKFYDFADAADVVNNKVLIDLSLTLLEAGEKDVDGLLNHFFGSVNIGKEGVIFEEAVTYQSASHWMCVYFADTIKHADYSIQATTMVASTVVDAILPFSILPLPVQQSKAYLPLLGDFYGEYRYTSSTAEWDAISCFGFVKPDRSRFENMISYDAKNEAPLSWNDHLTNKTKGATEALRRYIMKNNGDTNKKSLKFDNIKFVSYEGTDQNVLHLDNGYSNGMGRENSFWFSCKFIYEVSYDGETLKIPFTMRLGASDGINVDNGFEIGDVTDLNDFYSTWK